VKGMVAAAVALVVACVIAAFAVSQGSDDAAGQPSGPSAPTPSVVAMPPAPTDPDAATPSSSGQGGRRTSGGGGHDGATAQPTGGAVAPGGRRTARPVRLDAPARPAAGVQVRLLSVEAVRTKARLPGEVGGPSLKLTLEVDNGTAARVSLTSAVVNLYFGDALTPAVSIDSAGGDAFPRAVAAQRSARGVFFFNVPKEDRSRVRVEVDLGLGYTVVLLQGAAA
jgi:hypothetical protein